MLRILGVTGVLLALLLAGCAGSPEAAPEAAPEAFEEVVVTSATGAIRGVVVTETIAPIEGALVVLAGGANKTTDADGAFVFNGLEPGDYFLTVSKIGYFTVQANTVVVAGDEEPDITKVMLSLDAEMQPFTEILEWKAFLQCGAGAPGTGSWNPCLFTGSDNVHYFPFGGGRVPDAAQGEAIWSGTQPLGNDLYFEVGGVGIVGPSPLTIRLNQTELDDAAGDDDESIMVRVFAGDEAPTVVTNQAYDIYVQYFYGFVPREDYTLVNDGPCDPYTVCA